MRGQPSIWRPPSPAVARCRSSKRHLRQGNRMTFIWRTGVPAAGHHFAVAARPGLYGGEFVVTEQRPRMQSRVEVVPLQQGDAVVFAVNNRPVQGTKATYRVKMLTASAEYVPGIVTRSASSSTTRHNARKNSISSFATPSCKRDFRWRPPSWGYDRQKTNARQTPKAFVRRVCGGLWRSENASAQTFRQSCVGIFH